MGIKEIDNTLAAAATTLREETLPIAKAAEEQTDCIPALFLGQQNTKEDAASCAEEVRLHIQRLQSSLGRLCGLLTNGVQDGEKIAQTAADTEATLNQTQPSLKDVDSILATVLLENQRSVLMPPLEEKREAAADGIGTLIKVGQEHSKDFGVAKDWVEGMVATVVGLGKQAQDLARMTTNIGEPGGCLVEHDYWNPTWQIEPVPEFTVAIARTASAITSRRSDVIIVVDSKTGSEFQDF